MKYVRVTFGQYTHRDRVMPTEVREVENGNAFAVRFDVLLDLFAGQCVDDARLDDCAPRKLKHFHRPALVYRVQHRVHDHHAGTGCGLPNFS